VTLARVGQFRESVEYVQKAAKTLYETVKEVFERVKVTVQRLVELFVEAVARVLAWVDKHRAYLFLMAAAAAGVIALGVALNIWGLIELEKLAYAASAAPFFAGLADAGGKAAERFKALGERYERWRVDESLIDEVLNVPLRGERPYAAFLKLARSRRGLTPPLVELRKALINVKGEVEKDAAVVAALVLYKTLVKNAKAYGEWAGWYKWARGLVGGKEFTVATEEVKRLREAHNRLEGVAGRVLEELNRVLVLYSQSGFYKETDIKKLKSLLEVNLGEAEELAKARSKELSKYSDANMATKAYAALLSINRGGIYRHTAMLLMGEGALADLVLLAPATAHWKVKEIAKGRGEAVDPSYSRKGAAGWEDRAASVLLRFLIGYGEIEPRLLSGAGEVSLKFRRAEKDGKKDDEKKRIEKGVERGFQVFRVYGGVEAPVGELWIGKTAHFTLSKEELKRLVEEAERTAPDLSGIKKIWQALEWLNTDVSFAGRQVVGGTAHLWQLRWYFALFGGGRASEGRANVTEEGIKPYVKMRWSREVLDRIIAEEGDGLKPLLGPISKQGGGSRESEGPAVKSWRELVDVIDWSWVLKRVEELADELKPWIGPEKMGDAEREGWVRRVLGELALLVHFAEARRGVDDCRWREERAKRLAEVVEAMSGGRIAGGYAKRLAELIISYAEKRAEKVKKRIDKLAGELAGVSKEEVWGIVQFVLSDMYCLARDCARDEVMRKFVATALELMMLDKALRGEFGREEALLIFGEMYATAVAGDGTVGPDDVWLAVGGELGGGAALLRLATLHLLNQLLPDGLKFDVRTYVGEGIYNIAARGENAVRFKRVLAVTAPSAGGEYLSPKFKEFVKEGRVEVWPGGVKLTKSGRVAADLTISEGGVEIKYNIYLWKEILLRFESTDRSRVELAARLLRLAGVDTEVKKMKSNRDQWYVVATTDMLAAGREGLRNAVRKVVEEALGKGWVDEKRAGRWLEKLEEGLTLREGWPKYSIQLTEGALVVRFGSTDPDSIKQAVQRLREVGLVEGVHFSVKMPEGEKAGYVSILKEGLAHAAWLSVRGEGERQKLAAKFVEYILQRAKEAGDAVCEKAREIVKEGKERGSLKLEGFERKVEVGGREHVVRIIGGGAQLERSGSGKLLLRIKITAEVDGVRRDYTITYGRYGRTNTAKGLATARADAPGGREEDAKRLAALIKALTGKEPKIRKRNGKIIIECYGEHLDGFARYAELADTIEKWQKTQL